MSFSEYVASGGEGQDRSTLYSDPGTTTTTTTNKRNRKEKYRDAFDAASKFREQTDYKARKEAKEKENARAQRATMKISDDISVMEGFTDEPFTIEGQKGTRGGILGTVGSAVGGYFGGPLGGQIGGTIGSSFG